MAPVGTAPPPIGVTARTRPERAGASAGPAPQSTRLRFALGDFMLGGCRLRVLVDPQPFYERLPLGAGWFEPAAIDATLDGLLVRGQPIAADLPRFTFGGRYFRYVPQQYDRCTIDLTLTWEKYLGRFSARTRSTLRRKVRRFEEAACGLDLRAYRAPADLDEYFAAALFVSRQTYQSRRLDCGLPETAAFRAETAVRAAHDAFRGYVLFAHGEPAAFLHCPIRDNVVEYAYVGHDPHLADLSPGSVLLFLALERLFGERRYRLFDFTEGEGPHKRLFATSTTRCADIYTLRRSARLLAAARLHALLADFSAAAGHALERVGVKRWLRRRLRGAE